LTDQPAHRPDSQRADSSGPSGFEPPRFAAPYDAEAPTQPHYGQGSYGQGGYGQNQHGDPGPFGAPYGQPPSPYNQPPGPYSQTGVPYGQPGYFSAPEPKTLSIASMVCGIASVIMGFLLLPQIAAIVTGHLALKREPSGKGMSITGLVLGYLCLLGYAAFWLLLIVGLAVARTTSGTTPTF
jgi:hypothetical protein